MKVDLKSFVKNSGACIANLVVNWMVSVNSNWTKQSYP